MKDYNVSLFIAILIFVLSMSFISCEKVDEDGNPIEESTGMFMGKLGCFGCHSMTDRSYQGPSFKGIYGRVTHLDTGDSIIVGKEYIRKSILHPNADIVNGYIKGIMPKFDLNDRDIERIIEYLQKLPAVDSLDIQRP